MSTQQEKPGKPRLLSAVDFMCILAGVGSCSGAVIAAHDCTGSFGLMPALIGTLLGLGAFISLRFYVNIGLRCVKVLPRLLQTGFGFLFYGSIFVAVGVLAFASYRVMQRVCHY
jgi:hypothetical protein